jgi:alkylation response protein AidB-like acyl-CoA dehydrogenase
MERELYTRDHEDFRVTVRRFVERHVEPNLERWDRERLIGREVWTAAAEAGILGLSVAEEYGGAGVDDFRFRCVVMEELARVGAAALHSAFSVHDDIVTPYVAELGDDAQRQRWLPGIASGQVVGAIAMTEPGTGSDLRAIATTARPASDGWVLDGQKTFISNGIASDVVIVVARTESAAGDDVGLSLFLVGRDTPGFARGRKLDKVGLHAQDTAELFFDGARLPAEALLGVAGQGLRYLKERLPRERLAIAVSAVAAAEAVCGWTRDYCASRNAFGASIDRLQHVRFVLASMFTETEVLRTYVDAQVRALNAGTLTATDAAKAKWWATDTQLRVTDRGLQLHGGYGYMMEYPIAKAFVDSRVQSIYGGTNEIMQDIVGREIVGPMR